MEEAEDLFFEFLHSNENPVFCYGNNGMKKYFLIEKVQKGIICGRSLILGPYEKVLASKVVSGENFNLSSFYKVNLFDSKKQ